MFKENKDVKAKKYGKVSDKPDSRLAGPYPTAHSNEFVPIPLDQIPTDSPRASEDIFDFIPTPKNNKYK